MATSTPEALRQPVDLDALFRLYQAELNKFAFRRLKDREGAADVVQDAFVRYMTSGDHEQGNAVVSPRFFLWRIVGNLTINVLNRKRRWNFVTAIDDVSERLVDPNPMPDRFLEARQELILLKAALDELPANCRTALLLNRLDGLTHPEIGARMKVSASMVSKYIMTALRHCFARMSLA